MQGVLVLGSVNVDMRMQLPALPRPGETLVGSSFQLLRGGKGANQAVAAARLGAPTRFLCCMGRDEAGEQALRAFKAEGIDTRFILRAEQHTGTALILVAANGENCIAVYPGANAALKPEHLTDALFEGVSCLLVQLEVPLPCVARAVDMAFERGIRVMLNPAPAQPLESIPLHKVFLFTPNETEAATYTGSPVRTAAEAKTAADRLRARGIANVVITLGRQGAFAAFEQWQGMSPAFEVAAVDSTAAGDVFHAALSLGLTRYQHIPQALRFAHAAAALSVQQAGAQPPIPKLEQVQAFLAS